MAEPHLKHVTIIGVGLLGGSLGLALQRRDPGVRIAGVGRRQKSLKEALDVGAIHTAHLDAVEAVGASDLVVLATPVGAFGAYLQTIAEHLKGGALVTDVGSTKAAVVRIAAGVLGPAGAFVGSHPMAGSDRKGPTFARADLFAGATCILTPTARTPRPLIQRLEAFWQSLGMTTVRMSPAAHDKAMANISHLPHVLAALLMRLPGQADLSVAATGFRDMTRLAGGDPEMWRDILLTNRSAMLASLDKLDEQLAELRDLLETADAVGIEKLLAAAKKRRDDTVGKRLRDPSITTE